MAKLLVLAAAITCACSSSQDKGGGSGAGSGGDPPHKSKYVNLSVEIDAGGLEEITLVVTDETGSTRRISIGEYPGPCEDVTHRDRDTPMKPLLSAICRGGE